MLRWSDRLSRLQEGFDPVSVRFPNMKGQRWLLNLTEWRGNRWLLSRSRTDQRKCGILSDCKRRLLVLPLLRSFGFASSVDRHDLMDSFGNSLAVPPSSAISSLPYCQFLLYLGR